MSIALTIRIPNELAERLTERKEKASVNISAFVRRAIERELDLFPTLYKISYPSGVETKILFTPKAGE